MHFFPGPESTVTSVLHLSLGAGMRRGCPLVSPTCQHAAPLWQRSTRAASATSWKGEKGLPSRPECSHSTVNYVGTVTLPVSLCVTVMKKLLRRLLLLLCGSFEPKHGR